MFYKIVPRKGSERKIYVSPDFYYENESELTLTVMIRAGLSKEKVIMIRSKEVNNNEIWISEDVLHNMSIPFDIMYQIRIEKNEIHLGPVIGLMLFYNSANCTEGRREKLLEYALRYEEINGLLYILSYDGIDLDNKTAEGFYYYSDSSGAQWKKGVFPLPDVIFRRIGLSNDEIKKLKHITGNRLFNSYFFDKWEFWNMVSKDASVKSNVPDTKLFESFDDVHEMLQKYDSVFLKPINGTLGNGLIKVMKEGSGYFIQRKHDENPVLIKSRSEAADFIEHSISNSSYIVQQDIHLLTHEGGFIDFRVVMQKDYSMEWNCTSIVACAGAKGGIHSNYMNDGSYLSFEDYMIRYLQVSKSETAKKRQEIIDVCKDACNIIDTDDENYGDLGIDVGLDKSFKPWIFEMNKSHFYYVPLMIDDYDAYYAARTNPVKYAAALAGFKHKY